MKRHALSLAIPLSRTSNHHWTRYISIAFKYYNTVDQFKLIGNIEYKIQIVSARHAPYYMLHTCDEQTLSACMFVC